MTNINSSAQGADTYSPTHDDFIDLFSNMAQSLQTLIASEGIKMIMNPDAVQPEESR